MADETIKLNNENTIGVTFNKSDGNKIRGATVTVTGSPTYAGKKIATGSFNVTSTDGTSWTSTDNNETFKSFMPVETVKASVEQEELLASTTVEPKVASASATSDEQGVASPDNVSYDDEYSNDNTNENTTGLNTESDNHIRKANSKNQQLPPLRGTLPFTQPRHTPNTKTGPGGSRKSHRRTKNRNSKRRGGGRSKRRSVNH